MGYKKQLHRVFKFAQRNFLGYETDVRTFSQAGEDILVRNFFYERLQKRHSGTYVDIGAYHPFRQSNTYYLYRCGWRGLNVDPRPGIKALFTKHRPQDVTIEVAVSSVEGDIEYFCFDESPSYNTSSSEYIKKLDTQEKLSRSIKVPTKRLDTILYEQFGNKKELDFLSIDIEGSEVDALRSNNWDLHRFKLIAVEIFGNSLGEISNEPASQFLSDVGYEMFARVLLSTPGVNTVFFTDVS